MTAAYHLLRRGYAVEIFEALDEPGGMAAVGIPDYRMPRHLLQREADIVAALGVEIEYGVKLGRDVTLTQLKEQYDAVFLGTGAFKSKPMGVEGEDISAGGERQRLRLLPLPSLGRGRR